MKTKKAIKCIEVLESIKINQERALFARLDYVVECLKNEIMTNEYRKASIIHSMNLKKENMS